MRIGRVSIVVSGHKVVGGLIGQAREVTMALSDREANGEAFPNERIVRLPRRMCRVLPTGAFLSLVRGWPP